MRRRIHLTAVLLITSWCCQPLAADDAAFEVTIHAGDHDRRGTMVELALPRGLDSEKTWWMLHNDRGDMVRVERGPSGRAWARVDLKKGESKTYVLSRRDVAPDREARARKNDGRIAILIDDREVLQYQGKKTPLPKGYDPSLQRGGYIHPVYTPTGVLVTDDYPHNHKHHHGIWAPWTKTEFEGRHPDFWNMAEKTGTIEHVEHGGEWSGAYAAGFTAKHRFIDLTANPPKAALDETWEVMVHAAPFGSVTANVIDLKLTQSCASDSPLILPKYHYGGLGFRGSRLWDGSPEKCRFLTSEGKTRADGNETTGRWCHVGGAANEAGDALAGVAILCHPDNFRFPQPMRLHPTEPFFCFAPSQGGDWRIEPGKPYVARYRFVVADGPPDKAEIERLWNDYANPPRVEVK